jgi:riboflavin synthase
MFTGIIEELGTIKSITTSGEGMQLNIMADKLLSDVKLGDSIAVNGACLTVTSFTNNMFSVDVMPETFRATSLSKLQVGSRVNLERALAVGDRMGGHFVTGHVDGVGVITKITLCDNAQNYTIRIDKELLKCCIYKGCITVDGTSLTIFGVNTDSINLAIIPHTVVNSVIGSKKVGDIVNIECDMLGKYVTNLMQSQVQLQANSSANNITPEMLLKNGFIN